MGEVDPFHQLGRLTFCQRTTCNQPFTQSARIVVKFLLPLLFASSLLSACSGTHSTIKEGFAYRLTEDQAAVLVDSVIRSNIANDRMLPGSKLVASGYDRSITDTQTYTATAIAVPRLSAFGFELQHEGTLFNGPSKAKRLYRMLNERAVLAGPRIPLRTP